MQWPLYPIPWIPGATKGIYHVSRYIPRNRTKDIHPYPVMARAGYQDADLQLCIPVYLSMHTSGRREDTTEDAVVHTTALVLPIMLCIVLPA